VKLKEIEKRPVLYKNFSFVTNGILSCSKKKKRLKALDGSFLKFCFIEDNPHRKKF